MLSRLGFVYFSNNSFYVFASYQKNVADILLTQNIQNNILKQKWEI